MRDRLVLSLAAAMLATTAGAQAPAQKSTVLSLQPLTAMFTIYSGEVEQRLAPNVTLGAGGSHWSFGDEDKLAYTSWDAKLRYYPEGHALSGFAVGVQGGYTRISERWTDGTTGATDEHTGGAPTAGLSLEYNWLLGQNRSFFVGLGAGAKKVFINADEFNDPTFTYPTGRISIGYAF
jgi:hypothetical protein